MQVRIEKSNAETRVGMAVTKKQTWHRLRSRQILQEQAVLAFGAPSSIYLSIYLAFHLTPLTHLTHPSTTRAFSSSPSTPPSLINSTV